MFLPQLIKMDNFLLNKQQGRSNEKTNQEIDDVISSNILFVTASMKYVSLDDNLAIVTLS
jgi:hypothetical protein